MNHLQSSRPRSRIVSGGGDFKAALNTEVLERMSGAVNAADEPGRGSAGLDNILTNVCSHYAPTIISALGTSDHRTVIFLII